MKVTIGTRGSALALWQAHHIRDRLLAGGGIEQVELLIIKTRGDLILDRSLSKVGGKGLFITELEDALLDGRVDLAVHSMKDMPAALPDGLAIVAVPERACHLDALVVAEGRDFESVDTLPHGAVVGTSSLRRSSQLLARRPDLVITPIRGNVDTRLRKLDAGEGGMVAIILASAGLERLGWGHRITEKLDPQWMIPAVAQGALALEARDADGALQRCLAALTDPPTDVATRAERAFLSAVEGSCQVPVGGFAQVRGDRCSLRAFVGKVDGSSLVIAEAQGSAESPEAVGRAVADEVLRRGGREILADLLG